MKITMREMPADQSLGGERPELWVTVQSNKIVDFPRVRETMTAQQATIFGRYADKPTHFYPHFVTAEERAETGYRFDDTWAFPKIGA